LTRRGNPSIGASGEMAHGLNSTHGSTRWNTTGPSLHLILCTELRCQEFRVTYRHIVKMLTRKRALVEVNANDLREPKLAKRPNRDQEHASVPQDFREKSTEAPFTGGPEHVCTQKHVCS
jgi:hypothetical protein